MHPFDPPTSRDIRLDPVQVRFLVFRTFTIRLGLAMAVVPPLIFLLWMYSTGGLLPEMAFGALATTVILLLFPLAVWAGLRRGLLPWFLYGGTGVAMTLGIWSMARVPHGYALFLWVLLYPCLFTPILSIPFTLKENAIGLTIFFLVPAALRAGGLAPGFPLVQYYAMVAPAFSVMAYFKFLVNQVIKENEAYRTQIEAIAHRDGLTGAYNRRFFMDEALRMLKQAQRSSQAASLMMFDIDHFKKVNDTHGHSVGDLAIQAAARIMQETLRETDLVARFGGEEFVAFLPDTDLAAARVAAERVRAAIQGAAIPMADSGQPLRFTASLGVTLATGASDSLAALLERADKALYVAKGSGRNRVEEG